MDVRWEERDVKTAYANAVSAGLAPDEITLRFGMQQGPDLVTLSHSIVLNPVIAKQFSIILRQAMAQYHFREAPAAPAPSAPQAPILPLMEGVSEQARLPLGLIAGLGAGYALTGSFKMYQGSLLGNRYLITLAKAKLGDAADARIIEICRAMGMPQDMAASFAERLGPANYVHFGFEEAGGSCLYKVYMEYWTTWKEELEVRRRSEPFVGRYGYQWDTGRGAPSAV